MSSGGKIRKASAFLTPKMNQNNNSIIIEIRPGVGGKEAKVWAADLLRMYQRFASRQNFKTKLLDEGVLKINGEGVYSRFKQEAGVHRVQRVPETERHGRIHTSTASVAVLPEIKETELGINPDEIEFQAFRASTQGGQNVQKVSTAVRLTHKPSGVTVTCQTERSQHQNRDLAMALLRSKLWALEKEKKETQISGKRTRQIGRAMRAEKIKTYNFPQNRITDHRLKRSYHDLIGILDGGLEIILEDF